MQHRIRKLTTKTKLLIYEYKERYPELSAEFISELFYIELPSVIKLFNDGEIIVPSKINK
jgi:hypothetical protein